MDKLYNEIRAYQHTDLFKKFEDLFEARLQKRREQNDAAPLEEVAKNQGAISELRWLLNNLTTRKR
jgi:hypothetical protein